jgi:voltage-dependent calcium channel L type alpha-1D
MAGMELERRPTITIDDTAAGDETLHDLEGEKYDPFAYRQIVEEQTKSKKQSGDSSSKKKQQAGMASNLRPKRALFCLSVSNPIRRACIALVEWKPFDFFILANIFATCAVLAAYEPLPSGHISERNQKLEKAEYFFIVVFTAECIFKVLAYGFVGHPGAYLRSAWNMLDFFIVVIGFVSLIFEKYINVDVKALRAFRVLRPLRLVTGVPSLQVVLASILKAMIPLFYIALLVVFFIIIYAIIGVELFMGIMHYTCYNSTTKIMIDEEPQICSQSPKNGFQCPPGTECLPGWEGPNFGITSFDNMGIAGLTVFTCITLEGWTDVMYFISDSMGNSWIWFYFITLILLGSFFVLNLILGVLSGEFAKEKARQSKSGKFQKVREKHLIDEAVKGYMDWIAQADEDRDREEKENKEEKRKRRNKERKAGIQVNDDLEEAMSGNVCSNIGGCWAKLVRKTRRKCRSIVKSQTFYWAVIIAVFLNSMVLAVEHYNQPDYVTMFLDRANYFFLCLFCLEMLIKMFCLGFKGYFNSLFNRFDCVVVLSSLLEAAITIPTGMLPIGISVMRCVRLLRIFKVTRYWESLSNLVGSLLNSIKSIASLLLLLALFMLIFSLLGMQIFGGRLDFDDIEKPRSNFDSFWRAFVTVFQIMTGEDWNACMYYGIKSWGGFQKAEAVVPVIYYISLVVIGNFILLNVFLAIAVDNLADADSMTQLDKEEKKLKKQQKKLRLLQKRGLAADESESESDEEPEEALEAEVNSLTGSIHEEAVKAAPPKKKKMTMRPLRMSELNMIKNIPDPMPDATSFFLFSTQNPFRIYCYKLCTHPYFMNTILVMIMCSSILLAAEDPLGRDKARNLVLDYFDYIFTAIFSVEILVKLIAYGTIVHAGSFCRSAFNILDLLIVLVSIVAIVLRNSKEISVVRILRVLRVLRPLRAINRAKGLKHVVQCVIVAIKSIGNIMLVTILFIFLFSVIGIQLFKGSFFFCNDDDMKTPEDCQGYFYGTEEDGSIGDPIKREWNKREFNYDNVFQAMMTLFVVMTFEGWPTILENSMDSTSSDKGPVQDNRPWVAIYYIIYIIHHRLLYDEYLRRFRYRNLPI